MAAKTTVVIVNWNSAPFLEKLLESIPSAVVAQTIVIDNASTDHSMEVLERKKDVYVLRNHENLGFGVAANQGIELSRTRYVLLLNADIEVLPGAIETMEQFLEENSKAAVVAPQLRFQNGRIQLSCRAFPTMTGLFLYLSFLDRIVPSDYRWKEQEHRVTVEVDQPMGAALMFRKRVLQEIGLFDPRFFMYMEDVDLCLRIKQAGWTIFYLPEAQMIHHAGGSSAAEWERTQTNFLESVVRYFRKYSSPAQGIVLKFSLVGALVFRSLVLLVCGRFRQSRFYLAVLPRIFSY